jgi:hypothetical protein
LLVIPRLGEESVDSRVRSTCRTRLQVSNTTHGEWILIGGRVLGPLRRSRHSRPLGLRMTRRGCPSPCVIPRSSEGSPARRPERIATREVKPLRIGRGAPLVVRASPFGEEAVDSSAPFDDSTHSRPRGPRNDRRRGALPVIPRSSPRCFAKLNVQGRPHEESADRGAVICLPKAAGIDPHREQSLLGLGWLEHSGDMMRKAHS